MTPAEMTDRLTTGALLLAAFAVAFALCYVLGHLVAWAGATDLPTACAVVGTGFVLLLAVGLWMWSGRAARQMRW